MDDYQKLMIKLKMAELTQRQCLIALTATALGGGAAESMALEGEEMLDKVGIEVRKHL